MTIAGQRRSLGAYACVGGTVAFGIALVLYLLLLGPRNGLCTYNPNLEAAKTFWGASSIALWFALLINGSIATSVARQHVGLVSSARWALIVGICLLGAAVAIGLLGFFSLSGETLGRYLGRSVATCPLVGDIVRGTDYGTVLSVACSVVAFAALAQQSVGATPHEAAIRLRSLKTLLYAASSLLVVGVIEVYALYSWATAVQLASTNDLVPRRVAVAAGLAFSALLAILFLPAAGATQEVLRQAIAEELKRDPEFSHREWADSNGHDASSTDAGELIAVLAPFLSSAAAAVLG